MQQDSFQSKADDPRLYLVILVWPLYLLTLTLAWWPWYTNLTWCSEDVGYPRTKTEVSGSRLSKVRTRTPQKRTETCERPLY